MLPRTPKGTVFYGQEQKTVVRLHRQHVQNTTFACAILLFSILARQQRIVQGTDTCLQVCVCMCMYVSFRGWERVHWTLRSVHSVCSSRQIGMVQSIFRSSAGPKAGDSVEMETAGGECGFVGRLVLESLDLGDTVTWYTSMLGKKSSVTTLKVPVAQYYSLHR